MNCNESTRPSFTSSTAVLQGALHTTSRYSEKAYGIITLSYKVTNKVSKFIKSTRDVVELFSSISENFSGFFTFLDPIKIIQVPLYTRKAIKACIHVYTAKNVAERSFAMFAIYKCAKKMTSGVAAGLKSAVVVGLAGASIVGWTGIADYIFLPVTFISAALNYEHTLQRSRLFFAFCKKSHEQKSTCQFIQDNHQKLRNFKIISKDFDVRFEALSKKIHSENAQEVQAANKELGDIVSKMKWRMGAYIALKGSKTALKSASCAMVILGFTTGIGLVPAVFINFGLAVGALSCFIYGKHLAYNSIK